MLQDSGHWTCVDCGYSSKFKNNVFKHVESKHVKAMFYTCKLCGKVLRGMNSFKTHTYREHRLE